jgi:hypothetical protein
LRPPSDFRLLKAIHEHHRADYIAHAGGSLRGRSVFVPVDIPAVARSLRSTEDVVFGRLYYHLEQRYGEEKRAGEPRKAFFTPVAGDMRNCVNFPVLEAVLAGLWDDRNRDRWTFWAAGLSVAVAGASLIVSIVT